MTFFRTLLILYLASLLGLVAEETSSGDCDPGKEAKPWTRWWWLGSGVDQVNLTAQLEAFALAGLGGVEICPIYGAKGFEDRDLKFLSKDWVAMLAHTSRECERLGLGMDLTTGTGWPFGGPSVSPEMASQALVSLREDVEGGLFEMELPADKLVALMAFPEEGDPVDLADRVKGNKLKWKVPEGHWRIRGIAAKKAIQKVKRAAPGGAGNVLDPYSVVGMKTYLGGFDKALSGFSAKLPRAHFHDSFEYYGADWTTNILSVFEKQHGYDLRRHLPALMGEGDRELVGRVGHDYKETLDELHRAYLETWRNWADGQGSLTRNQAHGSPGNLLDHYAVAGIPETEIFRHVDEGQIPMLQFASSAAHVTGKRLVSAESFTWLGEHFQVTPAALKEAADFLWLGGVNHIFYHGVPYSPEEAGWPGWLFYASTHMGINGGLWRDLPAFNAYVARVQSELQKGEADTSVLLYFPVHDLWSVPSKQLPLFTIHNQEEWLRTMPFYDVAMEMWNKGVACDFISDRLLANARVNEGLIVLGGAAFKTLVIPKLNALPVKTAAQLKRLADEGASIAFLGDIPSNAPGLAGMNDADGPKKVLSKAPQIEEGVDLSSHLDNRGIEGEPITDHGLRFVRRRTDDGHSWFIVNRSGGSIDAWIPLNLAFKSACFLDPSRAERFGRVEQRMNGDHREIHFVMAPGESRILRTSPDDPDVGVASWSDYPESSDGIPIGGPWNISFIDGGPELPPVQQSKEPILWTSFAGETYRSFSGTAKYSTSFDVSEEGSYLLDLGKVAETCRVRLNGKNAGQSFFPPHRFDVSSHLRLGTNTLEVEVSNLAANRIADLDRRKVPWKAFHEINFVNIDYKPFDASSWKSLDSGLLGPVKLTPFGQTGQGR